MMRELCLKFFEDFDDVFKDYQGLIVSWYGFKINPEKQPYAKVDQTSLFLLNTVNKTITHIRGCHFLSSSSDFISFDNNLKALVTIGSEKRKGKVVPFTKLRETESFTVVCTEYILESILDNPRSVPDHLVLKAIENLYNQFYHQQPNSIEEGLIIPKVWLSKSKQDFENVKRKYVIRRNGRALKFLENLTNSEVTVGNLDFYLQQEIDKIKIEIHDRIYLPYDLIHGPGIVVLDVPMEFNWRFIPNIFLDIKYDYLKIKYAPSQDKF